MELNYKKNLVQESKKENSSQVDKLQQLDTDLEQEWNNFIISSVSSNDIIDYEINNINKMNTLNSDENINKKNNKQNNLKKNKKKLILNDEEDEKQIKNEDNINDKINNDKINNDKIINNISQIYISTKTKITYLNSEIDLKTLFWQIPIIDYINPTIGVIKKQMKFNTHSQAELYEILEKLKSEKYYEENIITHIDNPNGRIKFKDVRKISIGLSKKDILSYRSKKKSAFYNCFVLILRLKTNDIFKEYHVKVFNTGKLEIPGVKDDKIFNLIIDEVIKLLQPYISKKLENNPETNENVLINSNFNCGYYINREQLYNILKCKYKIHAIYDPCSYPGIQCKFYYDKNKIIQDGYLINNKEDNIIINDDIIINDVYKNSDKSQLKKIKKQKKEIKENIIEVSFMVFRTGSVLIVGKCDENIINNIYEFLKKIFIDEYNSICQYCNISNNYQSLLLNNDSQVNKKKAKKIIKKIVQA